MDVAELLIVVAGLVASVVTFSVLRYPNTRRPQFRDLAGFSLVGSLLGALAMFAAFAAIAYFQGQ